MIGECEPREAVLYPGQVAGADPRRHVIVWLYCALDVELDLARCLDRGRWRPLYGALGGHGARAHFPIAFCVARGRVKRIAE